MRRQIIKRITGISIVLLLFVLGVFAGETEKSSPAFTDTDLLPWPHYVRDSHPRMDYRLYRLYRVYREEGVRAAEEYAGNKGIVWRGGMVDVQIHAPTPAHPGVPEDAAVPAAAIPIGSFDRLLKDPAVRYISAVPKPVELDFVTEGVQVTAANVWQERVPARADASPVKVAVIDAGFEGYEDLLGSELPDSVTAVSFLADGGMGESPHGTGCAEIVHDMAPEAALYLLPIDSFTMLIPALNYCVDNGIDVISMSLGFYGTGASDGTGYLCNLMQYIYENGITWVKAGGNDAGRHWSGLPADPDGDGWINFTEDDEIYECDGRQGRRYGVFVDWEDWGLWDGRTYSGSGQDFDIYLFYWNGADWEMIDRSENVQDGDDFPYESMFGDILQPGRYGIGIKRVRGNRQVRLHLVSPGSSSLGGIVNMEHVVPEGSVYSGATSRHAVIVGAFNWYDLALTGYSSWGPTRDGRVKPDIASPTQVSCHSYGEYGMGGTSAAAPHVAGAIALIRSRLPFFAFEDMVSILNVRAVDEGEPGKDNLWGVGRLYLALH